MSREHVSMDTITDAQIRELLDAGLISQAIFEFATYSCWYNRDYRDHCAQIYNREVCRC
jgi:hypothetical protein